MSALTDITLDAVTYVCFNMREVNKLEIYPLRPHDSPIILAWEVCAAVRSSGRGRVAWHDGKPAGVVALVENWPGCWGVSIFATDDFRSVAINILRWVRSTFREICTDLHGRRLESLTRAGDDEAAAFFKGLGARPEGPPMHRYGKDGADFQRFVWLAGENDHFIRKEQPHVLLA